MIFSTILFVFLDIIGSLTNISKENSLKNNAEEAFKNKDFVTSAQLYTYLIDTLKIQDEKAVLNLAHSLYNSNNFAEASKKYSLLYNSKENNLRSIAAHQLGLMAFKNDNDKPKALSYYKDALRANPANADARYNYEFLKKLIEAKQDPKTDQNKKDNQKKEDDKKQDQSKQNQKQDKKGNKDENKEDQKGDKGKDQKDQQGKNGENKQDQKGDKGKDQKDQQGKNGENKENKPGDKGEKNGTEKENKDGKQSKEEEAKAKNDKNGEKSQNGKDAEKKGIENQNGAAQKEQKGGKQGKDKIVANPDVLLKMGMTDQRAKTLLDAMNSNEIQYIQQNKRESTKKSGGKGKPEW